MARHELRIEKWHPARPNQYEGRHWSVKHKLKAQDRHLVWMYSRQQRVPEATCKRRVSLVLTVIAGHKPPDPDASWKSLLDALKQNRLLIDDSPDFVELGTVGYEEGDEKATLIVLEDVD